MLEQTEISSFSNSYPISVILSYMHLMRCCQRLIAENSGLFRFHYVHCYSAAIAAISQYLN